MARFTALPAPSSLPSARASAAVEPERPRQRRGIASPRSMIHTVGPVWMGGGHEEAGRLADCHLNAIALAASLGCRTVAFPAISTGVFGYPRDQAARVAVDAVRQALSQQDTVHLVRFVLFDDQTRAVYERALATGAR